MRQSNESAYQEAMYESNHAELSQAEELSAALRLSFIQNHLGSQLACSNVSAGQVMIMQTCILQVKLRANPALSCARLHSCDERGCMTLLISCHINTPPCTALHKVIICRLLTTLDMRITPTPAVFSTMVVKVSAVVCLAQGPEQLIPPHMEVAHIPFERGGPYPGIYLYTAPARMHRPVAHLATGMREMLGSLEQSHLNVRYLMSPATSKYFAASVSCNVLSVQLMLLNCSATF